jgi:hypothetical protein
MILRGAEEGVKEKNDLDDIRSRFDRLVRVSSAIDRPPGSGSVGGGASP